VAPHSGGAAGEAGTAVKRKALVPSLALHSVPVANPIDEVCHSILYISACLFALLQSAVVNV